MAEGGRKQSCVKQTVPVIRKVLKKISDEITDEELTKLKFLASDELPKGQIQNMNCLTLISALEERQLIDTKNDDMDYLLELLHQLPRIDLINRLSQSNQVSESYLRSTISEEVFLMDSGPSTATTRTVSKSVVNHRQQSVDGGFIQDPDVLNSTIQEYHETVVQLEEVTKEKEEVLKALAVSETCKEVLQTKVNNLEVEVSVARDDQINLICERNNARAAQSEWAFKETEMRKEVSEVKRTKLLLEKSLTKCNLEVEKLEDELKESNETSEALQNTVKKQAEEIEELKSKLEEVMSGRKTTEEQLREAHVKLGENGRIECKRCGLIYVESNNPVDACRYHPGKYNLTGSIRKKHEWSCCKSANKNVAGCQKKKHLSIDYPLSPGLERFDTM